MDNCTYNTFDPHAFDAWAGTYDEDVRKSNDNDLYPFAGYSKIMDSIYSTAMKINQKTVLDIGVGTGILSAALYKRGHIITGLDFSSNMLAIAKSKMPNATFYLCDIAHGLPTEITGLKYDVIISTYALHHLPDAL